MQRLEIDGQSAGPPIAFDEVPDQDTWVTSVVPTPRSTAIAWYAWATAEPVVHATLVDASGVIEEDVAFDALTQAGGSSLMALAPAVVQLVAGQLVAAHGTTITRLAWLGGARARRQSRSSSPSTRRAQPTRSSPAEKLS